MCLSSVDDDDKKIRFDADRPPGYTFYDDIGPSGSVDDGLVTKFAHTLGEQTGPNSQRRPCVCIPTFFFCDLVKFIHLKGSLHGDLIHWLFYDPDQI
jgi:hypothetical protein